MPVLSLQDNLARIQKEIGEHFKALGVLDFPQSECDVLAKSIPLAHATSSSKFVDIAADKKGTGWHLLSPAKLAELGLKPLRPDSAEVALGTTECVFLYCGQFRYPETQVGFLFSTDLETDRSYNCEASPFDSGALHRKAIWPDGSEPAVAFLARHTLPVTQYREYLANRIQYLFAKPEHYLEKNVAIRIDPIGLTAKPPATTGDPRLWTFEIRVRNAVKLSAPYLAAVFYPRRLRGESSVLNFLVALEDQSGVHQLMMEDDGDFAALQRQCLDFLRTKRIIH